MNARWAVTVTLFAAYVACTSAGLLLFKAGWPRLAQAFAEHAPLWRPAAIPALGACLYVTSFLLWLAIVTRLPLTIAYPIAIGLSLLAVTAGAVAWLGESMTLARVSGTLLILAGVVLITR